MLTLAYTDEFLDVFDRCDKRIQRKIVEKVGFLAAKKKHTGLQAHRIRRTDNKWEMYVDMGWRVIYDIEGGVVRLWRVGDHSIVEQAHRFSFAAHTPFRRWEAGWTDIPESEPEPQEPEPFSIRNKSKHKEGDNPFSHFPASYLRVLGVPASLINAVRKAPDADALSEINGLPEQSLAWLLDLVTNSRLENVLYNPDRLLYRSTLDQLEGYCAGKIKRLMLNLHPDQQRYVDAECKKCMIVRGCAGSGKTSIGLYRAVNSAAQGRRVLVLTYTRTLNSVNRNLLEELIGPLPDNLQTDTVNNWMVSILQRYSLTVNILDIQTQNRCFDRAINQAVRLTGNHGVFKHSRNFLNHEITRVIKGCALENIEAYRRHNRSRRGIGLNGRARERIWKVYELYQKELESSGGHDWFDIPLLFTKKVVPSADELYDEIIIDEAQDLTPAQIRSIRKSIPTGGLMVLTDRAQTIYSRGYSWVQAGLQARGYTHILRKNYRSTRQITLAAAQLAGWNKRMVNTGEYVHPEESHRSGPAPILIQCDGPAQEVRVVGEKILDLVQEQYFRLADFAVLCPTRELCEKVMDEFKRREIPYVFHRDENLDLLEERVKVMTIHSAKGIEFPVVFLVGLNEGLTPSRHAVSITDVEEKEQQMERERTLLYVGMTRAAEVLYLVCTGGKRSRFVDEIQGALNCLIME